MHVNCDDFVFTAGLDASVNNDVRYSLCHSKLLIKFFGTFDQDIFVIPAL